MADEQTNVVVSWTTKEEAERGFRRCKKADAEVPIMACMFCPYGHMTCCHYPSTEHSKEFCGHGYG
jgi:hypothetical protein